jgi:hypothetical protein
MRLIYCLLICLILLALLFAWGALMSKSYDYKTCWELTCQEANKRLANWHFYLDWDGDWLACESLCF